MVSINDYKLEKLYFSGGNEAKDLRYLLQLFFLSPNEASKSYSARSPHYCKKTYYDEELNLVQCYKDRYRSFEDIVSICTTYFPDVDLKEILHTLITLDIRRHNREQPLWFYYRSCTDINRMNLLFNSYRQSNGLHEFKLGSIYSWKDLFSNLLNINTRDELYNYIELNRVSFTY